MLNLYKIGRGKRVVEAESDEKKTPVVSAGSLRMMSDFDDLDTPNNVKMIIPNKVKKTPTL